MGCSVVACGAAPTKDTVKTALDAMSREQRIESFEAAASALAVRPKYVDELYRVARANPLTMNRFLYNAARDLDDLALARETVRLLIQNPESLRVVMATLLEAIAGCDGDGDACDAVIEVISEKRYILGDLLSDYPDELVKVLNASLEQIAKKPRARTGLRSSMRYSASVVAPILVEDPKTLSILTQAMLDAGLSGSEVLKIVQDVIAGSEGEDASGAND